MSATISYLNKILDSGVQGVINSYTGMYVGLYSGGSPPADGGYVHKQITAFDLASNGTKGATARVNFAPTGASAGGWGYDQIRLYGGPSSGLLLDSLTVSPTQFIANLDVHQILITLSGS